jgi:hypothetical protein
MVVVGLQGFERYFACYFPWKTSKKPPLKPGLQTSFVTSPSVFEGELSQPDRTERAPSKRSGGSLRSSCTVVELDGQVFKNLGMKLNTKISIFCGDARMLSPVQKQMFSSRVHCALLNGNASGSGFQDQPETYSSDHLASRFGGGPMGSKFFNKGISSLLSHITS